MKRGLSRRNLLGAWLVGSFTAMVAASSHAFELAGAWVMEGSECADMFVKKESGVALVDDAELFGGGFVIEGDRIKGSLANCQIKNKREIGDEVHVSAVCTTRVMTSAVILTLRVVDQNNIVRFSPDLPGVETKYGRCAPQP